MAKQKPRTLSGFMELLPQPQQAAAAPAFCPSCGAKSSGEKFCQNCGTPLH